MIKSLHIKNFKCFGDQRFELGNLTLLTGLNGTGKSSVIQSLLLLRQSHQRQFLQVGRLLLNGDLIQLGTIPEVFFEGAKDGQNEFGFDLGLSSETVGWHFKYQHEMDVAQLASNPESDQVYDTSIFGNNFHYLPSDRIGPQSGFEISDYDVRERGQLGVKGEYAPHFLAVASATRGNNLSSQVSTWMDAICPGLSIETVIYPEVDRVDLRYNFPSSSGRTNNYRSTNVGFGITYTLPIVVALLASEKDALVLLENPEAHLHPKGQVKLGELMAYAASSGIQVIVETHSDHIIEGVYQAINQNIVEGDKIHSYRLSRIQMNLSSTVQYFSSDKLKQLFREFRYQ